jgi:tetratricopeptide (TPR) repeat protein
MAHQDRIPAKVREQVHGACYKFVLDHKSIPDDHKFKDDLTALAGEETNIQGILMEVDANALRPNAVDALIAFSSYQSYTKPSTVVAAHALRVALAAHDDPRVADLDAASRRVAEAYQCLGDALGSLDRDDEACKHFEEAHTRFKGLREVDLCCAGECSYLLLRTRIYLGADASELESLAEEARADLCHDDTKKYYVARGLLAFGHFLWYGGRRLDEALEMLSTAQAIFEEVDCPASTAECLWRMSRIYAGRNEYPEALRIARNGLVKAEQSGEIGVTCCILGCIPRYLILEQSYEDALVALTRLLVLDQASASPLGIGQNLELLAYICAARLDLQGAQAAYSGAQAQFRKIGSTGMGQGGVARCSYNLAELGRLTEMTQNDFSKLVQPYPMC